MMRVAPAPEPPHFEALVRRRGLSAISELVGELPDLPRRGKRRNKVAERREEIPGHAYPPLWRKALPDLLREYRHICAYTCFYIERVTGAPCVDHQVPKSRAWNLVYEWRNYRLSCALMNSRKGDAEGVLDPFEIGDDWFVLEVVSCRVLPGPGAVGEIRLRVEETLRILRLNDEICRKNRQEHVDAYLKREIPFSRSGQAGALHRPRASPSGHAPPGRRLMHPLHDHLARQLGERLKARRVVVWYDPRREFGPFIEELRGGPAPHGTTSNFTAGDERAHLAEYDGSFFELRAASSRWSARTSRRPFSSTCPAWSATGAARC